MNPATLKRQMTCRGGEFLAALLVLQPLLDVLSYFMQQGGGNALTTALRTVLLAVVCAYGLAVAEDRRPYFVLYGITAAFWLAHALNCLRLGYLDPVGDAAEYLKLVQFPLWTLVFITLCRQKPDMDLRAAGLLAVNFAIILFIIALSYLTGRPAYTYDIPSRGVKLGLLGWFGIPNAQSAILAMLLPGLLVWAYHRERLWQFALASGVGAGLLFCTGTRLTYYAAILTAAGFLVLVLLGGGRQRLCCIPLAVVLVLLVVLRGVSPMSQRQALTADSYQAYQRPTDEVMGADKDYVYDGGEIPPEVLKKITRVYEEVYAQKSFAGTPLLGDLLDRFGTQRVMEHYRYSTRASTLYNVRTKKLAAMALIWQEQDALTRLLGVEYARASINGSNYDPENDFPGLFYFYGWLGTGLYACFAGYFLLLAAAGCLRRLRRLNEYLTVSLGGWAMLYVLGLGAAQFSGQVLRKPSVTVYLSLAAAQLYTITKGSGKLFARYDSRPAVTMKKL